MRLANRALVVALTLLVLCAAASAQTLRNENDPRNISPTVGTGGPTGGPTGLFTIYDGQTLRKGEFTFSIAYSNFDRDPGNVDLTEVPVSFQVGLSDHLELFFNTDAYRGIKVNHPQHLSSFYLPNSQLKFPALGSGPAIVLAPQGPNVGTLRGTAVFRPAFNQPFVPFPFVGNTAGTFGVGPGALGTLFGFPGFNATLGPPVVQTNSGSFGSADNFPGIGSVVGGILPGIVLATETLPPTILSPGITVPVTYTVAPTYLPDAPFINRLYGQSSFNTFVVGAKFRKSSVNNAYGVGAIAFYRFYADNGNNFNQLQRGSSPGGDIGDFGIVLFTEARLSRSVNISVNSGFILNSNPKAQFTGAGEAVLLDRPNELLNGIAFDFPVNKYLQPILELRSTRYVGGRTPNAFGNNPVEALAGIKIYPARWWGFGLAYRYHINQQDRSLFEGQDANTQINQTTNVLVPGRGVVVIPATSRPATVGAFPRGFTESEDANGFIAQLWIGRRNKRYEFTNDPPSVTLDQPPDVVLPVKCEPCSQPSGDCVPTSTQVQLTATASDPDKDPLLYTWAPEVGRITVDKQWSADSMVEKVTWDLTGVAPGRYTVTVEVDDGCGCVSFDRKTVTVRACDINCIPTKPAVSVECLDSIDLNPDETKPITYNASVAGVPSGVSVEYRWTVSDGTSERTFIGQGTPTITVDVKCPDDNGKDITATVEVTVPGCPSERKSCTTRVNCQILCRNFDQYNDLRYNDEKARLDNFAIELQNQPRATGYIIVYRGEARRPIGIGTQKRPIVGLICSDFRWQRAYDYLVTVRGISGDRLKKIDGGDRELSSVELFVCEIGSNPPNLTGTIPDRGDVDCVRSGTTVKRSANKAKTSKRKSRRRK